MIKMCKIWIAIGLIIAIAGCSQKKELKLKQDVFKAELGTVLSTDLKDYLDTENITQDELEKMELVVDIPDQSKMVKDELSFVKTGEYSAKILYNKEELTFKIVIEDTIKPELDGPDQLELTQGEELATENLFTAKDLNELEEIKYDLSLINKDEPGDYSMVVSVRDIAGNETQKTVSVTVIEKKTDEQETTASSDTPELGSNTATSNSNAGSTSNVENHTPPQDDQQSLAASLSASNNTTQLLTVVGTGGSYADFALHEKRNGVWVEVLQCSARVGVNGIGPTTEWSRTTPNGVFSLGMNFGLNGNPGATYGYTQANSNHYWVDDVNSKYYNQFVDITQTASDWSSAEHIVEFPGYYNYCVNINYNPNCTPGVGSAIFIHCDIGSYTYGCVAIPESVLASVMQRLQSDALIAIYPSYNALY